MIVSVLEFRLCGVVCTCTCISHFTWGLGGKGYFVIALHNRVDSCSVFLPLCDYVTEFTAVQCVCVCVCVCSVRTSIFSFASVHVLVHCNTGGNL